MANLLIVEDDSSFSELLEAFLTKKGHHITLAATLEEGLASLKDSKAKNQPFDALLLDYRLPDGNALDLLRTARNAGHRMPAIIMTSFHDIRTAVQAMRSGVFDYITKPVNPDELLMVLSSALEKPAAPTLTIKASPSKLPEFLKGKHELSVELYEHVRLVAPTNMSVIIEGESGTGKEHIASSIHQLSDRAKKPFIAIDCGSLSNELAASELFGYKKGAFTGALQDKTGQFEAAEGGTLFLDEIGNLGYEVQIKLLRALQERIITPVGGTEQIKVDVRLIAATNDDLLASASKGNFREDLYYRLNEFKIKVPPLRDRGKDLDLFITHFVQQANQELERDVKSLSKEVLNLFHQYDWPGNLRELKNVIKRLILLSKDQVAGTEALPEEMLESVQPLLRPDESDLKLLQEIHEKEMITKVLLEVRYNKSKAAKVLNIDRKTLYYKMEKYQIK
jgi:two-component system response regulator HydG